MGIATGRIVSTYTVFNHIVDEPGHIACGMEWLDKGVYRWEAQHPPLARVAMALGPYLAGIRSQGTPNVDQGATLREGLDILYHGHQYDRNLALARMGVLPFFWIACLVVYWWGCRHFTPAVGVIAVFLFTFIPPILAHAGVATTDMALTAFLAAAFVAGLAWVERPTLARAACFGAAAGLMFLSKFSCVAFFPATVVLALAGYFVVRRPGISGAFRAAQERVPTLGLAVLVGLMVVWAGYRFSFGKVPFASFSLPFPEVYAGLREVLDHAAKGHKGYLLGETRETGFWNFYLVGIGVKSPLAFLALLGVGLVQVFRKSTLSRNLWLPLAFSCGTLLVGIFSTINIGIRHILPVYVGFSLLAAVAAVRMLEWGQTRKWMWGLLGLLVSWMALSSLVSHPDYIPYFNELAGSHPENILVDSDLDWGQDMKRLSTRLHQLGATSVAYMGFVHADVETQHGFPPLRHLNRFHPVDGWNAIGVTLWKEYRDVLWPDMIQPQERVGKSMFLWYFPPATGQPPR